MALIVFSSVSKAYSGQTVLHDFSLKVEHAQRVAILGPSGCGKTTVLRLLAGFIAPDTGTISIDGETVAANSKILQQPEQRHLGMVFQDLALWPHLTVEGNLNFGLKAQGISKMQRAARLTEILELVEMNAYRRSRPAQLSGGQQQRVALARALVLRPKALLMDEPLSNLDEELNQHLRHELLRLHAQLGFTLLYVTHDRAEATEIGTRIVRMHQGRIEQIVSSKEFKAEERGESRAYHVE
ncbi:MAG TPA: ABC transporter ATP-binding protein [Pyrinomonadaceae bacterium]|nr:ABC transporter ATP-binding protein [Pyrinomonadaceae bacterium]